ncbi:FAD-dependent oxidoreductase [Candidatus Micrarchaeota archaeon]|nr:FAD-dependent oxidoreductase [Candidatus Micrarchaeota archaeon]
MRDIIVVGGGPAAVTAAIYSARRGLDVLLVAKDVGGQAGLSGDIQNWTGFKSISGAAAAEKLLDHLLDYPQIVTEIGEKIVNVEKAGGKFVVQTFDGKKFESKAVIIATGSAPRRINVPGEKEFDNKGVTYCATCDGPLFAKKDVAVIGGANSALDAALMLSKICRKVFLINKNAFFKGEKALFDQVSSQKNVEFVYNAKTIAITGGKMASGVEVEVNGVKKTISVPGVFVNIGRIPATDFVKGVELDEYKHIKTDRLGQTNVPGLFAAGDCTNTPDAQIVVAAGEGCVASLSAFKYLHSLK